MGREIFVALCSALLSLSLSARLRAAHLSTAPWMSTPEPLLVASPEGAASADIPPAGRGSAAPPPPLPPPAVIRACLSPQRAPQAVSTISCSVHVPSGLPLGRQALFSCHGRGATRHRRTQGDEPDLADSGGTTCQDRSSARRLNLPQGLCLLLGAHSRRRKAKKKYWFLLLPCALLQRVNQFVENQAPSFDFDNGSSRLPCSACLLFSSFTVTSTARASVFEVADATGTSRTWRRPG